MQSSPRPKRVYRRDWKLQTRSVRGSVSLPRLHLITATRPWYECPTCFSYNDRLPICLWCKSTTQESAAAFWASMPKQRTVSAPLMVTWGCVPVKSMTRPPARARSTEIVSCPPSRIVHGAPSTRSTSSQSSSLSNSSSSSDHSLTTANTTADPASPSVDEMGHAPSQPQEGRFHTLPLRRKGHMLRTTAGIVVNKSRLSALFRKDAVPVLDKIDPIPAVLPAKTKRSFKPKESKDVQFDGPRPARRRLSTLTALPSLPTIPDSRVPILMPVLMPVTAPKAISTYTTPTPPSFLSPFWYRPEEYDRIPASPPASRPTSVKTAGPPISRPSHSHSRSEPFPELERPTYGTPSRAWKRRMSGFFRHSISVVSGHKATH